MKKALALIMAVTFVCCVLLHGTNKVFSLEAYVTGVAEGFSDIPSFESVTECWTKDGHYNDENFSQWINYYGYERLSADAFVYFGRFPVAYEEDGSLTKRADYEWHLVFNSDGTVNENPNDKDGHWPLVMDYGQYIYFADSDPNDDGDFGFFSSVVGFFQRLFRTIKLIVDIVISVFKNLHVLLPWNAVVEVT